MDDEPQVSIEDIRDCVLSAAFWAGELPGYSRKIRTLSDGFAIAAAIISTLTGLTAWSQLSASSEVWVQGIVVVASLLAAATAITPKIRDYAACAVAAASLATRYGESLGDLRDALAMLENGNPGANEFAYRVRKDFQRVRQEKALLSPFPKTLQDKRNAQRDA